MSEGTIRGTKIKRVLFELGHSDAYIIVEAQAADGECLYHGSLYKPFWRDFWLAICRAVIREIR